MRTFHTNTTGEVSGLLGDQIGRSTSIPESSSPILMNNMKKSSPLQKPKVFSNRSRVSSMKENLRHGSMYLTNQIETIGKLDQAFSNLQTVYFNIGSGRENPTNSTPVAWALS